MENHPKLRQANQSIVKKMQNVLPGTHTQVVLIVEYKTPHHVFLKSPEGVGA